MMNWVGATMRLRPLQGGRHLRCGRRRPLGDGRAAGCNRLSVSHERLGDLAVAAGDLTAARAAYTAALTIRQRLADADPGNTGWQRDLSVSQERLKNLD